jgi:hypothetical protein
MLASKSGHQISYLCHLQAAGSFRASREYGYIDIDWPLSDLGVKKQGLVPSSLNHWEGSKNL